MLKINGVLAAIVLLFGLPAQACSFRLADGKLLHCGMPRVEVLALAGQPLSKDVETVGVDDGEPVKGETTETWSYIIAGDVGGEYYLTLTLTAGKVVNIESKQKDRL